MWRPIRPVFMQTAKAMQQKLVVMLTQLSLAIFKCHPYFLLLSQIWRFFSLQPNQGLTLLKFGSQMQPTKGRTLPCNSHSCSLPCCELHNLGDLLLYDSFARSPVQLALVPSSREPARAQNRQQGLPLERHCQFQFVPDGAQPTVTRVPAFLECF